MAQDSTLVHNRIFTGFRSVCRLLVLCFLVKSLYWDNSILGAADSAFSSPILLESNDGTAGSAFGDLDRDGRIEFVAQEHFGIYDWDGNRWNTYRPLSDIADRLDRFGGDIEIGDINSDGWLDIVLTDTSNAGNEGELIWFENPAGNLNGEWIEHSVSTWNGQAVGDQITHAEEELGDVNGDGLLDIVVRDIRHGFWVHIQDENEGWYPRRFVPCNPREGLDLWDPDGDGDLDILLNGVWFETPVDPVSGNYQKHAVIGMDFWYPSGSSSAEISDYACKVIAGDFDGDGKDDILISNAEELRGVSPTKPHGIRVYLQPSDFLNDQWSEVIVESEHFSWHTLVATDMDGDGDRDIVAAISTVGVDNARAESALWRNDGGMQFTKFSIAHDYGYQGQIGDSDGDGDNDFMLPEAFSDGAVRFYQNDSTDENKNQNFGLVLQLESDWGVTLQGGSIVSGWADKSGFDNDLTSFGDPQLVFGLTPLGLAAIRLDGNDKLEQTYSTSTLSGLPVGNGNRTMFVVARYYNSTWWGGVAYGNGIRNQAFGLGVKHPSGELYLQGWGRGNDLVSTTPGIGTGWMVQSAVLNEGIATMYRDGVEIAQHAHNYETTLSKLVVGQEISGLGYVEMDVAAVLVYDSALNATERAEVEAYLREKYLQTGSTNSVPDVTIMGPSNGASYIAGETIEFWATASDLEEGDLTNTISWSSDLDGDLGSGGSLNLDTLSVGTHLITASVFDSNRSVGSASVSISVALGNSDPVPISPEDNPIHLNGIPDQFTETPSDAEDQGLTDTGTHIDTAAETNGEGSSAPTEASVEDIQR